MLKISERNGTLVLTVRVQPGASRDEVIGEVEGALKVRLRAPALEGRANEALIEFLAGLLKRPKSAVRILRGERNRLKDLKIQGVTKKQLESLVRFEA